MCVYVCVYYVPVVPHKADPEVSKIGNYRGDELLSFLEWLQVTAPKTAGCSVAWCSVVVALVWCRCRRRCRCICGCSCRAVEVVAVVVIHALLFAVLALAVVVAVAHVSVV